MHAEPFEPPLAKGGAQPESCRQGGPPTLGKWRGSVGRAAADKGGGKGRGLCHPSPRADQLQLRTINNAKRFLRRGRKWSKGYQEKEEGSVRHRTRSKSPGNNPQREAPSQGAWHEPSRKARSECRVSQDGHAPAARKAKPKWGPRPEKQMWKHGRLPTNERWGGSASGCAGLEPTPRRQARSESVSGTRYFADQVAKDGKERAAAPYPEESGRERSRRPRDARSEDCSSSR